MARRTVIESLPQAYEVIKEMELSTEEDLDYRRAGREAVARMLEGRMENRIDLYLEEIASRGGYDCRNGGYSRHLLTELGDIELKVLRTRRRSAVEVLRAYARRAREINQLILACFVLGLSTRKVSKALLPILGEPISPATVSRVAKSLDTTVASFHRRPILGRYRFLILDGVVLKRRTGAGSVKRVALGLNPEGQKEVIDFCIVKGETQGAWEAFLNDLYNRGLVGEDLKMIIVDGGKGLLAALPFVYPSIPVQRCWAHKTRNVLNYVRKADQEAVKADLHKISHASGKREAQSALGHFSRRWINLYPKAVACLLADEEELLNFFQIKEPKLWPQIRTTNAIERKFREVRRRTRPMGVFADKTSMERILYAIFAYENLKQGTTTPFLLLTQNS